MQANCNTTDATVKTTNTLKIKEVILLSNFTQIFYIIITRTSKSTEHKNLTLKFLKGNIINRFDIDNQGKHRSIEI